MEDIYIQFHRYASDEFGSEHAIHITYERCKKDCVCVWKCDWMWCKTEIVLESLDDETEDSSCNKEILYKI